MDVKQKFEAASKRVHTLTYKPSNDNLLKLYSLYKQATVGNVTGNAPGLFDVKGRAKYNAWKSLSGKPTATAMTEYITLVDSLFAKR
jgi:acyl-CoA-binding protein